MKNFIIMFGAQGSGKSTQARLLADKLGFKFISSGDLLRHLKEINNPIGVKLSEYWVKGELVPDDVMEDILYNMFEKEEAPGFVMDGFPRDQSQLESFMAECKVRGWTLRKVVYLRINEDECVKRLKERATIEKREDETEEAIRRRFQIYHNTTENLLPKYSEMGLLVVIDGLQSVEKIQQDIWNNINESKN